jgi:predicted amidophosphoribosyltransferase
VTELLDAAADLFLGATCPGCGRPGRRLCQGCAEALGRDVVRSHRRATLTGLPLWAAGDYIGLPQRLIQAAKGERRWDIVDTLGSRLARAVAGVLGEVGWRGPIVLVPVPSSRAAVRSRGFDVGLRLAVAAQARLVGVGVDTRTCALLVHGRAVVDQAGLGWAERQANLDHAHRLRSRRSPPGPTRPGILVDDVVTTGASLAEAWRALAVAGGHILGAATVAATTDR